MEEFLEYAVKLYFGGYEAKVAISIAKALWELEDNTKGGNKSV
ncbi:MAG: hypothetical protein ACOZCL_08545 [Bacillota bacterium]